MRITLIIAPIKIACSAQLSASFFCREPINLAIEVVTPDPKPKVSPRTKKKKAC